jgi:hypothetical protein
VEVENQSSLLKPIEFDRSPVLGEKCFDEE